MTKDQIAGGCVLINDGGNVSGNIEAPGNIISACFINSGGANQQVLLANGSTKPLSEFSGGIGAMSNYVQKIGADVQVIIGIPRKGEDEEEESEDDDDYITRGEYNNSTNQITNIYYDESQELTDTAYLTWSETNYVTTSKFYNFYQEITPPVMFSGFTASQSTMFTDDGYVHFTTYAAVWTQNDNVVINIFWVR
ncbi:MAG: hypothetical protein EZS28_006323 [Streblomastix strix]|uniref:Uncharacterized protein n=1 Tax=Streblomastix strix TaxID=222440 RepID=A0A5J4WT69_9EUKA|nr:MAG: hypothetical protein EZS28_006323 [Streblomastix strix]